MTRPAGPDPNSSAAELHVIADSLDRQRDRVAALAEPYLGTDQQHQGLLLHTIYHRPRGWDHVPEGRNIPCGESCMWGDYHLREAALLAGRLANQGPYCTFFGRA